MKKTFLTLVTLLVLGSSAQAACPRVAASLPCASTEVFAPGEFQVKKGDAMVYAAIVRMARIEGKDVVWQAGAHPFRDVPLRDVDKLNADAHLTSARSSAEAVDQLLYWYNVLPGRGPTAGGAPLSARAFADRIVIHGQATFSEPWKGTDYVDRF